MLSPNLLHIALNAVFSDVPLRLGAAALAGCVKHLQAREVLCGIQQAVRMIDAQPFHQALRQPAPQQLVGLGKNAGVFHAQAHQVIDVEEAPVIDFLRRNAPVRQPVWLRLQYAVQRIKGAALAGIAVHLAQRALHNSRHLHGMLGQFRQSSSQPWNVTLAGLDHLGQVAGVWRKIGKAADQLLQLLQIGISVLAVLIARAKVAHRFKDQRNGLRVNRQGLIEIGDGEAPVGIFQFQVPLFQLFAVGAAQQRQQHFAAQLATQRIPVNIEKSRVLRCQAVFQHVLPPWIGATADPHVVRNQIEH